LIDQIQVLKGPRKRAFLFAEFERQQRLLWLSTSARNNEPFAAGRICLNTGARWHEEQRWTADLRPHQFLSAF
jgi:hypothetical protein